MAKNITIAEGGTAKNFTAKKIKTKLQGSGTCNWVPEDEVLDYVDLKDKTFTAKGTYKPSDFNCDGFNEVTVDIPADVKEKTITKNGEFYAADDGCLGYSKVTVAVPEGGGGGPFTVRFFDDDRQTILKTDANVPYGGNASCTLLDGSIKNGLYFKGWNPAPTNVRGDMNCYPIRGDYIIDAGEIADDWETICENKGANYPLGAYKALVTSKTFNSGEILFEAPAYLIDSQSYTQAIPIGYKLKQNITVNIALHMVKVAEGEDGSTSTWMSTGVLNLGDYYTYRKCKKVNDEWQEFGDNGNYKIEEMTLNSDGYWGSYDWGTCRFRSFLNGKFLEVLPECIRNNLKEVNKSYKGWTNIAKFNFSRVEKTALDKIWIPSVKEWYTVFANAQQSFNGNPANLANAVETTGIDYTSIYIPSIYNSNTVGTITRTAAKVGNEEWYRGVCAVRKGSDYTPPPSNYIAYNINTTSDHGRAFFGFCL